ncbi:MAG: cyclic nucleotide-binding protein [Fibrobacteres bacterium]|nr:cyclic nucleotide-binding protein [Fibrobacterota bacterium]
MTHQALIKHINQFLFQPMRAEEEKAVADRFIRKAYRKRQYVLQAGDLSSRNTFVVEGCFRVFVADPNGKEHNLQFAVENGWIVDMGSLYKEEPSEMNIEALEDSTVLQIERKGLYELYDGFPVFNRYFRILAENAYIASQKRLIRSLGFTAEARYLDFIARYPHLLNRISDAKIASFLGMTPEFLSKLRRNFNK